jgi:hypothetical protein
MMARQISLDKHYLCLHRMHRMQSMYTSTTPFHTFKERIPPPVTEQTIDAHPSKEPARVGKSGNLGRQQRRKGRSQAPGPQAGKGSPSFSGDKTLQVRCEPLNQPHALIPFLGLSIFVAQRIRVNDFEQMWDSVIVRGAEEADGTLEVRVYVSNPDWNELLQIACVRSKPNDRESMTPIGCNLDHVAAGSKA